MVVSPGRRLRPERRGLLPHLAHRARRAPGRGGRAPARQSRGLRCTTAGSSRCGRALQLAMLEEVRAPEPPIRLQRASSTSPATPSQVVARAALARRRGGRRGCAARGRGSRACDASWPSAACRRMPLRPSRRRLLLRGAWPAGVHARGGRRATARAGGGGRLSPASRLRDQRRRRLLRAPGPARCRPSATRSASSGASRSWSDDHVIDEGGDLWHRRIEEIDAAGAALCGAPLRRRARATGLVTPPRAWWCCRERACRSAFSANGVLPDVPRAKLGQLARAERLAQPVSKSRGAKPSSSRAFCRSSR